MNDIPSSIDNSSSNTSHNDNTSDIGNRSTHNDRYDNVIGSSYRYEEDETSLIRGMSFETGINTDENSSDESAMSTSMVLPSARRMSTQSESRIRSGSEMGAQTEVDLEIESTSALAISTLASTSEPASPLSSTLASTSVSISASISTPCLTKHDEHLKRAAIKAILADTSMNPITKRRNIQFLMDGRRSNSLDHASYVHANVCTEQSHTDKKSQNMDNVNEIRGSQKNRQIDLENSHHEYQDISNQHTLDEGKQSIDRDPDNSQNEFKNKHKHKQTNKQFFKVQKRAAFGKLKSPLAPHQKKNKESSAFFQPTEQAKLMEKSRPKCEHYNRSCTIIASCCGAAFGCRLCHDECPVLPPLLSTASTAVSGGRRKYPRSFSMPMNPSGFREIEHHKIDRYAVQEIICRICYTRQSSKTNQCVYCNVKFGEYYCSICNLWMDADESPYHCSDCGLCRVGGTENFKHCHDCGIDIDITQFNEHSCKAGKYMSNCPICQEDLFCSRRESHEMPCGHAIHWHCFRELAVHDSRCPICKKTAETHDRMIPTWSTISLNIDMHPLPPECAKVVTIQCIDCEKHDNDRTWHFLGIQCKHCHSFNTVVNKVSLTGIEADTFLRTRHFRH